MMSLEIRLFGAFRVRDRARGATHPLAGKVRDLFAYLLLQRESTHAREHLAGLFWGDSDDEKARHCLNTTLWRLNRTLIAIGDSSHQHLRIDARNIGFNVASDCWIDVVEFETRCNWAEKMDSADSEQKANLYRQAVSFYDGDLLTDCYEDWCVIERERFRCMYARALKWLVTYYAGERDYATAIDYARRSLACDPLHEEVHRQLIQMYLALGQPADALRQFRSCEEVIRCELAQDLMPETRALLPQITGFAAKAPLVSAHRESSPQMPLADIPDHDPMRTLMAATTCLRDAFETLEAGRGSLQRAFLLLQDAVQGMSEASARSDDRVGWHRYMSQISQARDILAMLGRSMDGEAAISRQAGIRLVQ